MLLFSFLCFYKPAINIYKYSVFTRSWGFDDLLLYDRPWQIAFYILALLFIVPASNAAIVRALQALANALAAQKRVRLLLFAAVSMLSVAVFFLLREKYYFLGDFNLRLNQVVKQEFLGTEYLTMKLLYYFSAAAEALLHWTPYRSFVCYSCVAGGVFIFFSCLIADLTGSGPLQKLLFFGLHTCTALLLVFCGYIEIYATVIVVLNMYLYFGLRYLKYGRGFYLALLCLVLAVASHLLSLAVAPTLLTLWYSRNKSDFGFISRLSNSTIAGAVFLVLLIGMLIAVKKSEGLVLPLVAPRNIPNYMTMFSVRHFWEQVNGQLLACGLSIVFLPALTMKAIREKFKPDMACWFLLGMSGCLLVVILLLNLHRGSGDWDIMASTAVAVNLANAVMVSQLYRGIPSLKSYLLTAILGLNALHAFLWLHVNHTDRSIRKLEMMLAGDPGTYYTRLPCYLQVGLIFEENNLPRQAEQMGYKACNAQPMSDPRSCMFYAKKMLVNGKKQQSINKALDITSWAPFYPEAYLYVLDHFEKTKQKENYFLYLNKMFDAYCLQPPAFLTDRAYGNPSIYIALFTALFREEYPKKNFERLKKIDETVAELEKLVPKK